MIDENLYLQHHGILGQKWGIRRFQNPDGTLTTAGRKRYYEGDYSEKHKKKLMKYVKGYDKSDFYPEARSGYKKAIDKDPVVKDINSKLKEKSKQYIEANKKYAKEIDKFYETPGLELKYINKAADDYVKENWDIEKGNFLNKKEMRDYIVRAYMDDSVATQNVYAKSKEGYLFKKSRDEFDKAYSELSDTTKKYVKQYLGDYYNTPINKFNDTYGDTLSNLISELERRDMVGLDY